LQNKRFANSRFILKKPTTHQTKILKEKYLG